MELYKLKYDDLSSFFHTKSDQLDNVVDKYKLLRQEHQLISDQKQKLSKELQTCKAQMSKDQSCIDNLKQQQSDLLRQV